MSPAEVHFAPVGQQCTSSEESRDKDQAADDVPDYGLSDNLRRQLHLQQKAEASNGASGSQVRHAAIEGQPHMMQQWHSMLLTMIL